LQTLAIVHVADTLQKLDADLVFLQEVANRRQFDQLLARLGKPWLGHLSLRRDRGIAVVAQRGRLDAWEISRRGNPSFAATFQAPGLPKLGAVVVHADAFDAKSRNRQIGEATDYLIKRMEAPAKILVGDLNIDLDLDKRRDLFSNNEHLDVETYNYVATHLFDAAIGRGPTAEPDRRLDYIFSDANLAVIDAGPFKNHRAPGMDHDPLVGDLHFVHK
jgi:endonuclease/exonuclease/phosphatase family metal-dependent hydrolase